MAACGRDQKSLSKITKHLLGENNDVSRPSKSSSQDLAQNFSDFFINKIETIRENIISENNTALQDVNHDEQLQNTNRLVAFLPASAQEVKQIIQKSPNKSCELDPIPTWLLKDCIDELLPSITHLINLSMELGYVPKQFKSARIRPLLKKPGLDIDTLKNYRPVSNLPFISKVLEKVVDARLEKHLSENDLHEEMQSAYRKFHSTETALLKIQNDILQSLDNKHVTVLVLLDLSAAFDTIDHSTLLQRLEKHFGVTGKAHSWMSSYLNDRYQTVCVDGQLSEPVLMKYSVPQGSVLGPKNYIMYTKPIGDICRRHGLRHHFYADDSQLYLSFKPIDTLTSNEALHRIECCLEDIIIWMHKNMLKLNSDKKEVMLFSPKQSSHSIAHISVKVGDSIIEAKHSVRNLGTVLDSSMDMEAQVNSVCRASYAQLRKIGHIRRYLTDDATKSLVNSLVTSRLDYCNSLLNGIPSSLLNKLQIVQNTGARIISKTARRDHITPILRDLHWLPVKYRIQHKILTYTFKTLHGSSPKYLQKLITVNRPPRTLRSSDSLSLVVPKSRLVTYGNRSFGYAAPKLWNSLPVNIRNAETLVSFKRMLKTHLFVQCFSF